MKKRITQVRKRARRDPPEKRRLILQAALKELALHGFDGCRTERIAKLAGVSVGTVFKVFPDKNSLANAVYSDCLLKVRDLIGAALLSGKDARGAFLSMWAAYTDLYFEDPYCLVFFEIQLHDSFLNSANRKGRAALRDGLRSWIEGWQERGALIAAPSPYLRAMVIGGFMRMVREALDHNAEASRRDFIELSGICWNSIAAPAMQKAPET